MNINDDFFKKTQENLKKIKEENNVNTIKRYNIQQNSKNIIKQSDKFEVLTFQETAKQKNEPEAQVISLLDYKKRKAPSKLTEEEKKQIIHDNLNLRINRLMDQLKDSTKKENKPSNNRDPLWP